MHISLLGLPMQRVSPNDGNITYHRPVRVLFSLLLFLQSVVKLNGLTALEFTWLHNYGELMGALQGINTNGFLKKIYRN